MKFLSKGLEPEQRINLLFQLIKVGKESIKIALVEYQSKGLTQNDAVMLNNVSQQRLIVY